MMSFSDALLFHRLRRGERTAFEQVINAHYESVWRQHYLLCNDREKAADLTQETFIEAWRSLPRFAGRAAIRTWLYTIAVRVWQRKGKEQISYAEGKRLEEIHDRHPSPEQTILKTAQTDLITCALLHLPESLRIVLVLHYRQEMTHREIAQALDIPIGTVKTRLYEGIRRLRQILEKDWDANV